MVLVVLSTLADEKNVDVKTIFTCSQTCLLESEGDANVQRNIFELDGERPQPLPQGPRKQLERRG